MLSWNGINYGPGHFVDQGALHPHHSDFHDRRVRYANFYDGDNFFGNQKKLFVAEHDYHELRPHEHRLRVKYFITFGDSYSQTGFDITGTLPSASNPEGNPPMPGYTTDNGLNWIGYLISEFNTSLTLSYNFAYGGATTSASLVAPYESTVLCFDNQTAQFLDSIASHPSTTPWTAENTLIGVWIGVNDVGNIYWESNSTLTTLLGEIMDEYFHLLQQIYDAGARNFALLNVPRLSLMISQGTSAQQQEASFITVYNNNLASRLASFVAANSGAVGKIVDTQAPFLAVIDNPTAYGAANATCYDSSGTLCVWWNNYHPGQAVQKLVAEAVAAAWKGSFW